MKQLLVIGGGSIGERHVRCFQKSGRAEVSLCEVDNGVCTRVTEAYGLRRSFSSLDSALAEPVDAAVVCTPAHMHVEMACRLVDQGIAVLIEKPVSTSIEGVRQLSQAAEAASVPAAVAYVYRAHPGLAAMKGAIESRRFGTPVELVAVSGQHFPFYRPAYREIYYNNRATGGGAIQDALTHVVNAGEWLIGPITALVADAEHCVLDGVDVEDTVHLMARHGSVLASYSLNQHQAPNESTITVVCTGGTARFEMHNHRWLSCTQPGGTWTVEKEYKLERDDLFVHQANAFLSALEGSRPLLCTLREGIQTLRVNLTALLSVEQRRWAEIAEINLT